MWSARCVGVLSVIALVACQDSIEYLEDRARSTICERSARCGAYDDVYSCRRALDDSLRDRGVLATPNQIAAIHAGTVVYRADKAHACIESLGGPCEQRRRAPACEQIIEGTGGDGDPCTIAEECGSFLCEKLEPGVCATGTCRGFRRSRTGEPCSTQSSGSRCESGACLPLPPPPPFDGVCVDSQNLGRGSICVSSGQCEVGLGCVQGPDLMLVCDLAAVPGALCNSSVGCPIGQECNASFGTCVQLARAGEPCSFGSCNRSNYCDAETETCVPLKKVGESCVTDCDYGSYCGETCVTFKSDGDRCVYDGECTSRNCDRPTEAVGTCSSPGFCF
jgi:hypothetical protein